MSFKTTREITKLFKPDITKEEDIRSWINLVSKQLETLSRSLWYDLVFLAGLEDSKTWDPGSVADGAMTSTTLTVSNARVGNFVLVSFSLAIAAGAFLVGSVTADDTVTVTLVNHSGAPLDLSSGTLKVRVLKEME